MPRAGQIVAVGAENEYADVIAQVGGRWVDPIAVMTNPNTDPHSYEASPSVAATVAQARLVVQNGLGYDTFISRIEAAAPAPGRRVVDVARLLGVPASEPNPHLWYAPGTMPAVARAIARDLSALQPAHAVYFRARAERFIASLRPWFVALARFRTDHPGATVATTEPVADDLLAAAGIVDRTPLTFQLDVMNGTDPAPQAVSVQNALLSTRRVRALVYNQQVTDTVTEGFLRIARAHHIPVVGAYETMPTGDHYQSWMLAEVRALDTAVRSGRSTERLR